MSMTLGELLKEVVETPQSWANRLAIGLTTNSRDVRAGDVFFAVRGGQRHGLEFLEAVRSAGALAVLWEPPWEEALPGDDSLLLLAIPELRRKMGEIASRFYGEPSRHIPVVGITGTDGKTSCAHFLAQA
ncbi:MAG: UDP-N-acetylmuramoyl-L-alanyl-D-glutamate--2,6-diaminopimelate ligase, partial [Candidatus Competibacteraceae bacterium]|nr:UDP-N-acetylmuramoyl-L-alanyl-D-glutamate--2,6-diaminopimelate ligase [Candidatus Competibacteraceae bacterium]